MNTTAPATEQSDRGEGVPGCGCVTRVPADSVRRPSAVEGLSVPQVRSSLSALRQKWQRHSSADPMRCSFQMPCDMTACMFAYHFVLGHHRKRVKPRPSLADLDDGNSALQSSESLSDCKSADT